MDYFEEKHESERKLAPVRYQEARVELYAEDLDELKDTLVRINSISGEVHAGNFHYGLPDGTVVSFGLRFDEDRGEHVISFAALVVADE